MSLTRKGVRYKTHFTTSLTTLQNESIELFLTLILAVQLSEDWELQLLSQDYQHHPGRKGWAAPWPGAQGRHSSLSWHSEGCPGEDGSATVWDQGSPGAFRAVKSPDEMWAKGTENVQERNKKLTQRTEPTALIRTGWHHQTSLKEGSRALLMTLMVWNLCWVATLKITRLVITQVF